MNRPATSSLHENTVATLRRRGFNVYTRPYELNVVAVRSPTSRPGLPDELHVFFTDERAATTYVVLPASTDVPTFVGRELRPEGDEYPLLLIDGQHVDALDVFKEPPVIGHQPNVEIVQARPLVYLRDFNRQAPLGLSIGEPVQMNPRRCAPGHLSFAAPSALDVVTARDHASAGSTTAYYACHTWQLLRAHDLRWLLSSAERHHARYGAITYTVLCERTRRARQLRRLGRGVAKVAGFVGAVLAPLLNPEQRTPSSLSRG